MLRSIMLCKHLGIKIIVSKLFGGVGCDFLVKKGYASKKVCPVLWILHISRNFPSALWPVPTDLKTKTG